MLKSKQMYGVNLENVHEDTISISNTDTQQHGSLKQETLISFSICI